MQITSFYPMIVTSDVEGTVKKFEELGFEVRHRNESEGYSSINLRNADGFNLDVSKSIEAEENTISIRMNVRDIDEALQILEKQGYKNYLGDGKIIETNSQKCARMDSPFGYSLVVIEHIRKEDREKK